MKRIGVGLAVAVFVILLAFRLMIAHPGYSGIVSEVKGVRGGVLIDLDGRYPAQRMTVWVPRDVVSEWRDVHSGWPPVGTKVTITGPETQYRGRPEIIISDPAQAAW